MGDLARAVPDVDVWGRLTLVQLRRVGVDSLPVALFIAAFTGVVLALQASYTFRNTVPLYFVGTLVGKTMMLEPGEHGAELEHHRLPDQRADEDARARPRARRARAGGAGRGQHGGR